MVHFHQGTPMTKSDAPATGKGILITFEGGEGGGKTTQVARLRERLNKAGRDVIVVREPGGTVISEKIREILLDKQNTSMAYTTEVLLFQAGRAQIYREIVLPSLAAGKVVLMDRSRDSARSNIFARRSAKNGTGAPDGQWRSQPHGTARHGFSYLGQRRVSTARQGRYQRQMGDH